MPHLAPKFPHFSLPFRFVHNGHEVAAVVNEQHSIDDIFDCVEAIVRYIKGERTDYPEFGITDQLFSNQFDLEMFAAEIGQFEPRAQLLLERQPALFEQFVQRVRVEIMSAEESDRG